MPRIRFYIGLLFVMLCGAAVFTAQSAANCPANVLLALARSSAACSNLQRDMACYGSGAVRAEFQSSVIAFEKPGDRVEAGALSVLRVGGENTADYSVAMLQIKSDLIETQQRNVMMVLFGEGEIRNEAPETPSVMITASGTMNIRERPAADALIVDRIAARGTITATGRSSDANWYRVVVPNSSRPGWVSGAVVVPDQALSRLAVVDAETPYAGPFQMIRLQTGMDDAWCEGAPQSGLVIQTPNTFSEVTFIINDVTFRIAATVYIQAQAGGALRASVLDGQMVVMAHGKSQFVPRGAQVQVTLDGDLTASDTPSAAVPYEQIMLQALPINILPQRIVVRPALSADEIEAKIAEYAALTAPPLPTETPIPDTRCRRETLRAVNLRSGPGDFYEVVREVPAGTALSPVYRTTDAGGAVWWQLRGGSWVPAGVVRSSGNCEEVPPIDVVPPPPTNYLSLETCETTNGPIRAGQWVEIEFVPPGWDTLAEAREAVQVAPGQITVDSVRLRVYASQPIRVGPERYIRTFSASWTATSGTHRIVGQRLFYTVICNLTVPVG